MDWQKEERDSGNLFRSVMCPLFMKSVVLQQFECLYLADHSHSCLPLQVLQMGNCLSGYRRSLVFFFFLVVQGVFVLL
jgi:hypothetical protein